MAEIFTSKQDIILVDDSDLERLSDHIWHLSSEGYAQTNELNNGRQRTIKMHRFILGLSRGDGVIVDHINGIKTDNRRFNLRICSLTGNARNCKKRKDNTTGYKGVTFKKKTCRFAAQIRIRKKTIHLGYFDTAENAHSAYCAAAVKLYGEFANFGVENENIHS